MITTGEDVDMNLVSDDASVLAPEVYGSRYLSFCGSCITWHFGWVGDQSAALITLYILGPNPG